MIIRILYSVLIVLVIFSGLNCSTKLPEQKLDQTASQRGEQFGYQISPPEADLPLAQGRKKKTASEENDDCLIWWCEGTYKIRPKQTLPDAKKETIEISAARNEYEPFQLIIYPKRDITLKEISITDFTQHITDNPAQQSSKLCAGQNTLPADNIEIFLEEYVPIIRTTSRVSERKDVRLGPWPDPLLPVEVKRLTGSYGGSIGGSNSLPLKLPPIIPSHLKVPLPLEHSENHNFWFNIYVPSQTPAGDYEAKIRIKTAESSGSISAKGGSAEGTGKQGKDCIREIPVQLHIFDFTLPQETHTRTAYGVNINNDWHNLKEPSDFRLVYDLYLQVLHKHRICPYEPMAYYPMKITKITPIKHDEPSGRLGEVGESPVPDGTTSGQQSRRGASGDKVIDYEVLFDFSEFDKGAEYYLDKLGFNSFNFPIVANYNGNQVFNMDTIIRNDEHKLIARKILNAEIKHLEEKGWLKKAYCYWIDEPDTNNIPLDYVKDGFKFLKENTPGLKRLLTLNIKPAPDSRYFDYVNLWVPILHLLDLEKAKARQAFGEEVWWYVCCSPREPYPNNFIDHPAINHRIRYWMMEKYNIQGDLYWSTTWWNYRNPYEDAASYSDKTKQSSYGNGDGLLLYPPVKTPLKEPEGTVVGPVKEKSLSEPLISAPFSSIRLELIREGLEDREYFWLLKQEINRVRTRLPQEKLKDAETLLSEPDNLIRSLRDFEKDPQKIYQSRLKIALMIEELNKIK